jgi:hypothetical protein
MRRSIISLLLTLFSISTVQAEVLPQFTSEYEVIAYLQEKLRCTPTSGGLIPCELEFRGLKVRFANVSADGYLTVLGMGENQEVRPVSRKCILVWFGDKDLRFPSQTGAVFQNKGRISHMEHIEMNEEC